MVNIYRIFKISVKKNTDVYQQLQKRNLKVPTREIYHLQYNKEVEHQEWAYIFNNLSVYVENACIVFQQFSTVILSLGILDNMSIRISKMGRIVAIRWNVDEKIQVKFYTEQECDCFYETINNAVVKNLKYANDIKYAEIKRTVKELNKVQGCKKYTEFFKRRGKDYYDIKKEFLNLINKEL